ncbi:hippurate hydrolase [Agaricicola taiwanensis]|uniref:Hippurate hydrolase n=1 Tax=Agaricicola taiwanensis TaxID=591372 RepID=A0A8J2YFD6_9RHOB|nr:M20 aminoacylase family protein [Agaricicola taiwanensis]GGE31887.1 hippurate hydrolase [Agaricicola taiwanensis]
MIREHIEGFTGELMALRHDFHAHPEIGFEEHRTAGIVAERLEAWGLDVHRNIGRTGVVGVLRGGSGSGRRIGLRADMDALPMTEATDLPYRSKHPNVFHGCGHDGHTTMLLGAARYLAETRRFNGTAVFIFQPAEEGLGGARAMIADGLFDRFPCDEIYALHNAPHYPEGTVWLRPGATMAGADFFDIRLIGRGGHAALPSTTVDPIIVATTLAQAIQTIVSRNVDPLLPAVASITQLHSGAAYNVIPDEVHLTGTLRALDDPTRDLLRARLGEITSGIATTFGAVADIDIRDAFTVLDNQPDAVAAIAETAREVLGPDKVVDTAAPFMGSEDFADMLRCVPGAYFFLGQKNSAALHNPAYEFDDDILPIGAALFARHVERRLS